jgi:hypothetical protein
VFFSPFHIFSLSDQGVYILKITCPLGGGYKPISVTGGDMKRGRAKGGKFKRKRRKGGKKKEERRKEKRKW